MQPRISEAQSVIAGRLEIELRKEAWLKVNWFLASFEVLVEIARKNPFKRSPVEIELMYAQLDSLQPLIEFEQVPVSNFNYSDAAGKMSFAYVVNSSMKSSQQTHSSSILVT